jgi:hypothetical protein
MDKIMRGDVRQVPRWHFVVKNSVLWIVGLGCVIAGALTVSLIIFTVANSAFILRDIAYYSFLQHVMIMLPLLWIFITILFVVLVELFVRHTKQGYKYSLWLIILVNMVLSAIVGVIFYSCGISHALDDVLDKRFRNYHSVERRQAHLFNDPEKGMIIGRVTKCEDDYFTLVTPDNTQWHVMRANIVEFKQHRINDGQRFVVVGKMIDDGLFIACDIRMRGMVGGNKQLQHRYMDEIHKTGCMDARTCKLHSLRMPQNIEEIIRKSCEQM